MKPGPSGGDGVALVSPTAVGGCAGIGMDTAQLVPTCHPDVQRPPPCGASATRSGQRRRGLCRNWHHSAEGKQAWDGGLQPGGWQCQLGTCSPTVPPAPSRAAGSGDRAHTAFQQDHPPHARVCDSPPCSQAPSSLYLRLYLVCMSHTHGETPAAAPACSHPCVCIHKTRARVCTQTCTKEPQSRTCARRQAHTQMCIETSAHPYMCTHKLAPGSTQPSWPIPRVRDKKAKPCPFPLNTLAKR